MTDHEEHIKTELYNLIDAFTGNREMHMPLLVDQIMLVLNKEKTEYAQHKVAEQRKLMAEYLATHFNMRNVPKPKFKHDRREDIGI